MGVCNKNQPDCTANAILKAATRLWLWDVHLWLCTCFWFTAEEGCRWWCDVGLMTLWWGWRWDTGSLVPHILLSSLALRDDRFIHYTGLQPLPHTHTHTHTHTNTQRHTYTHRHTQTHTHTKNNLPLLTQWTKKQKTKQAHSALTQRSKNT